MVNNSLWLHCPLCKSKAYYGKHMLTEREIMSLMKLKEELQLYNDTFGTDYEIRPSVVTTYSVASGDYSKVE